MRTSLLVLFDDRENGYVVIGVLLGGSIYTMGVL